MRNFEDDRGVVDTPLFVADTAGVKVRHVGFLFTIHLYYAKMEIIKLTLFNRGGHNGTGL